MSFTHLFIETQFSMNGSNIRMSDLVKRAVSNGYTSLAITDTKMHGTIKFYKECKANNINPVIGLNLFIEGLFEGSKNHILLYAKNNKGYQNLLRIASLYSLNNIVSLQEIKNNKQAKRSF